VLLEKMAVGLFDHPMTDETLVKQARKQAFKASYI
jgi:hypothetical protein